MTNKLSKIWVDPSFKRIIKSKAAEKDLSIIDYTKLLASEEKEIVREKKKLKFFF